MTSNSPIIHQFWLYTIFVFFLAAVARHRGRSRLQIERWNELHVHFILPYFIPMSPVRCATLCWEVRGIKNRSFVCNVTVLLCNWTRFAGNQVTMKWGDFAYWRWNYPLWRGHPIVFYNPVKKSHNNQERETSFKFIPTFLYIHCMRQRTVFINKIRMLRRTQMLKGTRRNYYRPTWHALAHDVSDLPTGTRII